MNNVSMDYYTASWCGPCRSVKPAVLELKAAGWDINVIDADDNPDKVAENQVRGIPTFIVFKDGVQVNRWAGARNKDSILGELNKAAGL